MPKFMNLGVLASGTPTTPTQVSVTASNWAEVINDVTSYFSVDKIVGTMSAIVVAGIGFVFLWWGARKAYRAIMKAVTKGKTGI